MNSVAATRAGLAEVALLLLDTTVLIDALTGKPAAERLRRLRDVGDVPLVCAVTVEELWHGLRRDEEAVVRRFVQGLRIVPLSAAEGQRAGIWRREHAARGITLHQADCLIAAAAVAVDATLVTGNPPDFPMPELRVEHWPVGE